MNEKNIPCFEAPETLWEVDRETFNLISSSPICSEIHHLNPLDATNKTKLEQRQNINLHKTTVEKISGFLQKNGCILVTGFRGVGKSSVVYRSIAKYFLENSQPNNSDELDEEVILVSIPMEQSLDLLCLVRIIFRNILTKLRFNQKINGSVIKIEIKDDATLSLSKAENSPEDFTNTEFYFFNEVKNKLELLYYGLEIYIEHIKKPLDLNIIKKFTAAIPGFKLGADFNNTQQTYSFPKTSTSQLIYELKDFINLLTSVPFTTKEENKRKNFKLKFIFIFDELDRLKSQEEIIEEKEKGKSGIYLMELLVKELKVLFNQTQANFIFIAGVDMYEKWQAEKSRGDGIYEGIFSENFYINSLLTQDHNSKSKSTYWNSENPNSLITILNNQYDCPSPKDNDQSSTSLSLIKQTNIVQDFLISILKSEETKLTKKLSDDYFKINVIPGSSDYYSQNQEKNTSEDNLQIKILPSIFKNEKIGKWITTNELSQDIENFIKNNTNYFLDLKVFKSEFSKLINSNNKIDSEIFQKFFADFKTDLTIYKNFKPTITLQSFCRYLLFKSRGILRKLIREINDFIIIKNGKPYLYIGSYEAPKTKFFSGVEKLIESKMPAHYLRNDKNKVLLYLIIDSSFKFYKEGLNVEDWETFSILPDREKVLIDKKIYNDAIDILTGNYIELSFGRKTLYQFTPKYFRQIDHIIKKIPHEQHNFNISFLDYNEHLQDLQNQLKELKQNTAEGAAASLGIQIEIGKTYRKLNNPVKAVNCFKNAIKLGIDDAGNFLHDSSNSLLKLHRIGIILDQICECYIEIGLLEFEVKNNKKGISYLWAGVKVFLDFYGQLLNITTYTGPINTDITDKNPASSWEAFDPFSFENKKDTLKFLEKLLDFIFYIKESKSDDKEKEFKNIEDFKQLKIKFLDELKNEILPNNLQKIKNQEDLKILLKHMFKNILSEENFDREIENAFYSTGYDPSTTFSDQGKLGNLHGYLIVVNQKLRNEKLAEFFSPKLLYCINTLSTVYSRLGQFELSAQLLRAGITISDNTSFHSNAIVQRLQLALFYLLRFDFIKSIKYYQATFRYLNVQRKYWQSNYYVNNEMLAGLFDIVGILQGVLVPLSFELDNFNKTENRQKTIRKKIHLIYFYTAQNYYLKENNNRKNTTSKIKLIKSLIYQGINEFHLIHNCKIELKLDKNNKVINFIKERAAEKDSTLFKTLKKDLDLTETELENYIDKDCEKLFHILKDSEHDNLNSIKSEIEKLDNKLKDELNRRLDFFTAIIFEAVETCKNIFTLGRSKNWEKENEKYSFSIVRNTGEALSHLGEISLILARMNFLLGDELIQYKKQNQTNSSNIITFDQIKNTLNKIWEEIGQVFTNDYSILEKGIKFSNFGNNELERFDYYRLAESFFRVTERIFSSFYMPESNNIPLRLGMIFYFISKDSKLKLIKADQKSEILEISVMYLNKAIRGFKEYENLDNSGDEWIVGAHSDLGNAYSELSKLEKDSDKKIQLKKLAITNFKKSLDYFTLRINGLFASLSGKEPTLKVSLDSLFDIEYCFYLFQRLSRRLVSSHWKNKHYKEINEDSTTETNYGFKTNTVLMHSIGKYLKKCIHGPLWDITCLENDEETLNKIHKQTKFLSNVFRNFGGIENEEEIKMFHEEFQKTFIGDRKIDDETNPFGNLIKDLNKPSLGELRTQSWPIGGYRFIFGDEDSIVNEINNFTEEYVEFRGQFYKKIVFKPTDD